MMLELSAYVFETITMTREREPTGNDRGLETTLAQPWGGQLWSQI